jgi:adhesin transport system outer membrane protein
MASWKVAGYTARFLGWDFVRALFCAIAVCLSGTSWAAYAQPGAAPQIPAPDERPLDIDFAADPILALARGEASDAVFRALVIEAVRRHPATGESTAGEEAAVAELQQAEEAERPSVDANITSYRVLTRDFSNDPFNIIERSRPVQRTDATLSVTQTLFDFGAGEARVAAAGARLRSAGAQVEFEQDRIALSAIAAWYDVFGYRALVELTRAFLGGQSELRESVQERIRLGASAEGDLARVDSYIAQGQIRLAQFERRLATAEVRFTELTGSPPPPGLERAPGTPLRLASRDAAAAAALDSPGVRAAEAQAAGARHEAEAANAERFPQVSAGIDAGRYGVFENERDYDVRARISVRQRLFGGIEPRARQFQARARGAEARAERVRVEAERDAAIAWADLRALEEQQQALERAYIASRQSRDVIVARFRAARGTLFDVIAAEDAYFGGATAFIQGLTELDASRYILLSRTGRLLARIGIDPDRLGPDQIGPDRVSPIRITPAPPLVGPVLTGDNR